MYKPGAYFIHSSTNSIIHICIVIVRSRNQSYHRVAVSNRLKIKRKRNGNMFRINKFTPVSRYFRCSFVWCIWDYLLSSTNHHLCCYVSNKFLTNEEMVFQTLLFTIFGWSQHGLIWAKREKKWKKPFKTYKKVYLGLITWLHLNTCCMLHSTWYRIEYFKNECS